MKRLKLKHLQVVGRMTAIVGLTSSFYFVACSSDSDRIIAASGGVGATQTGAGGTGLEGSGGSSACAPMTLFAFDKGKGGFVLSNYVDRATDTSADGGPGKLIVNLNAPGDAGNVNVFPEFDHSTEREHTQGHEPKGALSITAQFTDWNQWLIAQVGAPKYTDGQAVDFTDMSITAQVYLEGDTVTPSADLGGAMLFLQTGGAYLWGAGEWAVLKVNQWTTVTLDAGEVSASNGDWDPSDPKQLGIQISSGSEGSAGAFGIPRNVTLYIDDVITTCTP